MLSVLPLKDKEKIKELFEDKDIEYTDNAGAVLAECSNEVLGECLYYLDDKSICILSLSPQEDIMLADGILRSALHVAAERSAMDASYAEGAPEEIFSRLGFIKDKQNKTLDIDKLFGGCGCKE